VGLQRVLDELGVRRSPADAGEHPDVSALHEAEATGSSGYLRQFPRQEVPALLAVELRRLGEEERLAGRLTPCPRTSVARRRGPRPRGSGLSPHAARTAASLRRGPRPGPDAAGSPHPPGRAQRAC
jgi:hypothetical protein